MDLDDLPKVMGDDGQFHAVDEEVDLSHTTLEGWAALGLFWLLGATVFYQFFTRYALNDSAAWTEEIARYLLVCTVFIGIGGSAWRKNSHIHVDLLLPLAAAPDHAPRSRHRWSIVDAHRLLRRYARLAHAGS